MLKYMIVFNMLISGAVVDRHGAHQSRKHNRLQQLYTLCCTDANEVYLPQCVGPKTGDLQCDSLEGGPLETFMAPAGCYCRPGYARETHSKCVPTEECEKPLCDGPNEEYLTESDAPPCDPSCRRLDRKRMCSKNASEQGGCGCYCIEGAARNEIGVCVPSVSCPQTKRRCLGTNEVFLKSKEALGHDKYCNQADLDAADLEGDDDDDDDDDGDNNLVPKAGCYCREGYFRNANHQCVERRFCKVKCPAKNEIFLPPGAAPRCENRCDLGGSGICLPLLDMPMGCYCRKGFCKNKLGACMHEDHPNRAHHEKE